MSYRPSVRNTQELFLMFEFFSNPKAMQKVMEEYTETVTALDAAKAELKNMAIVGDLQSAKFDAKQQLEDAKAEARQIVNSAKTEGRQYLTRTKNNNETSERKAREFLNEAQAKAAEITATLDKVTAKDKELNLVLQRLELAKKKLEEDKAAHKATVAKWHSMMAKFK